MTHARSVIREISAEEYVAEALRKPAADSLPLTCTMEITERCCFRCVHCYLGSHRLCRGRVMPPVTAMDTLDRLAEAGVLVLVLTGGEPLLHPDFHEIFTHAHRCGFLVTIATNASLLDSEKMAWFEAATPRRFEVSILGHTQGTYEAITRIPGSYDRFRRGVNRLLAAGMSVAFKFPVLRGNRHELDAARTWALGQGGTFRSDPMVVPTLDGGREPLAERLPPAVSRVLLPDRSSRVSMGSVARPFRCGAGLRTMHVDAGGALHPCVLWRQFPMPAASVTAEGWADHVRACWARVSSSTSECAVCNHRDACRVCPAISVLEGGVVGRPVAYYCEMSGALPPGEAGDEARISPGRTEPSLA